MINKSVCFLLAVLSFAAMLHASSRITVVEKDYSSFLKGKPVAPWADDKIWSNTAKLFVVPGDSNNQIAECAGAWNDSALYLQVIVYDDIQLNDKTGRDLWDGDAVQLHLDMRGDSVPAGMKETSFLGPDEASLAFALTAKGPESWVFYSGLQNVIEAPLHSPFDIKRDEQKKTTTYRVSIPWAMFNTVPGLSPVIGLTVQVNDADSKSKAQTRWYWGGGRNGAVVPGLMNKIALGAPPRGLVRGTCNTPELWGPHDKLIFPLCLPTSQSTTISLKLGNLDTQFVLAAKATNSTVSRYELTVLPNAFKPQHFRISCDAPGKQRYVAQGEVDVPMLAINALQSCIDSMVEVSPHPLFSRHLRSTSAMIEDFWNHARLQLGENRAAAREVIEYAKRIRESLVKTEAGSWESYRMRRKPLCLAYISSKDQTLQFYQVYLPKNWNADSAYPCITWLHGAYADNPRIALSVFTYEILHKSADRVADSWAGDHPAYIFFPWSRGNLGYRGLAEDEVWESLDDFKATFKMDENRNSLCGASMGGIGTFNLAIRKPDLWSAVTILCGGAFDVALGKGMGANLYGIPTSIIHGEADERISIDNAYVMQKELESNGIKPRMTILPGIGHSIPDSCKQEAFTWLLSFTRSVPDSFSYRYQDDTYRGRNGIRLFNGGKKEDPPPAFTCVRRNNTVALTTQNAHGGKADLSKLSLDTKKPVTFLWNGKTVYTGTAKNITFGDVPRWFD